MQSFAWNASSDFSYTGETGSLTIRCEPLQGITLKTANMQAGPLLGLEIVDAINLGPQPLHASGLVPEVLLRQDLLQAHFVPTTKRPVECVACWRVHPEGMIDLEISTLTPGKWDGLAVQTITRLGSGEVLTLQQASPAILLFRPLGLDLSYAEFCHPHDGIELTTISDNSGTTVRYRLFGHDLEKGVILRGRLRGVLVPRAVDVAAAQAAYARFLAETPNLT
ncbi:MAG TPA: hypothetical protein PKA06_15975 [Gemmatales bacterium]|nr:hypothetical protein [Gemmatales bacterium]HMP16758.1 hypothetical protein [Gemmatales bacterium]